MRKRLHLSVRERVEAALVLLRRDNPRAQITVSELCRIAGVSRANLYASHPDVIQGLRVEVSVGQRRTMPMPLSVQMRKLRADLAAETRKNRALVYLVTELRAELQRERARNMHAGIVKGTRRD